MLVRMHVVYQQKLEKICELEKRAEPPKMALHSVTWRCSAGCFRSERQMSCSLMDYYTRLWSGC